MSTTDVDVAIIGAGYAGSLAAMLFERIGRRTALFERGRHPRFAIGESSTPAADLLLRRLGETYDLPELVDLSSYGRWKCTRPDLVCGAKRGFSYFVHELGRPFHATPDHATELLVAASADDDSADLHWLRQDVDSHLVERAIAAGTTYRDQTTIDAVRQIPNGWLLETRRAGITEHTSATLLLDASGVAGCLAGHLGLDSRVATMRTNTRAVHAHFRNVLPWVDVLARLRVSVVDHPFPPDRAALHHLFDSGWMWQLRFDDGTTSAGFVLDNDRCPLRPDLTPEAEWRKWLALLPSIGEQFTHAETVRPAGGLRRIDRVQSRTTPIAGRNWALLPNTAGFVDPLHSTGIAHGIRGIARLVELIASTSTADEIATALATYADEVDAELDLIDELVAMFNTSARSDFVLAALPYFVAATNWERRLLAAPTIAAAGPFLAAADPALRTAITGVRRILTNPPSPRGRRRDVYELLAPHDTVGLLTPAVPHMHHHEANALNGSTNCSGNGHRPRRSSCGETPILGAQSPFTPAASTARGTPGSPSRSPPGCS